MCCCLLDAPPVHSLAEKEPSLLVPCQTGLSALVVSQCSMAMTHWLESGNCSYSSFFCVPIHLVIILFQVVTQQLPGQPVFLCFLYLCQTQCRFVMSTALELADLRRDFSKLSQGRDHISLFALYQCHGRMPGNCSLIMIVVMNPFM